MSEKSLEYNLTPVLDFDALNKYISEDYFLKGLLEKYKRIKICIDTGRLHMQQMIDPKFDDIEIIKRFSKYAEIIHLWNVKIESNVNKVLVVTTNYHMRRCLLMAQMYMPSWMKFSPCPADDINTQRDNWHKNNII